METESSVSKSVEEKPLNTPDVSVQDAEAMANAMLLDSPLPNSERGNEEVLEDGGSDKLPEEGEGVKVPEVGARISPRRPLQVSLYHFVRKVSFYCSYFD